MKETVIVLDFGGQYNQLIARRVRECNVYCEILPYTADIERIKEIAPKGIIFTGGPNSVYDESSPHYTPEIFGLGIPILGFIGYLIAFISVSFFLLRYVIRKIRRNKRK